MIRLTVSLLLFASLTLILQAADPASHTVKFGKLSAVAPDSWKAEKPKFRLRSHQFRIPSGMEGVADAELTVNPEARSDPEKYFPQWKAQFTPPDGKTLDDVTKTHKWTPTGAVIHVLDVSGTWRYKEFPMAKKEEEKPDYRVIWALVVFGDEATYLRFSGPAAVIAKNEKAFETWLKGIK